MIYAMQPVGGGFVKLGCSENIEARHKQLESHYGQPLAILAVLEGGRETEREIHERFAHLRHGRTEQFRPASDLMAFLGRPLLVAANPEAIEAMRPAGQFAIINLKGSDAQAEWLDGIHRKTHISKSVIVRLALAAWAEQNGHDPFPLADNDQ